MRPDPSHELYPVLMALCETRPYVRASSCPQDVEMRLEPHQTFVLLSWPWYEAISSVRDSSCPQDIAMRPIPLT
jgi:hypothetical protein